MCHTGRSSHQLEVFRYCNLKLKSRSILFRDANTIMNAANPSLKPCQPPWPPPPNLLAPREEDEKQQSASGPRRERAVNETRAPRHEHYRFREELSSNSSGQPRFKEQRSSSRSIDRSRNSAGHPRFNSRSRVRSTSSSTSSSEHSRFVKKRSNSRSRDRSSNSAEHRRFKNQPVNSCSALRTATKRPKNLPERVAEMENIYRHDDFWDQGTEIMESLRFDGALFCSR